jgi:hypothetical protein
VSRRPLPAALLLATALLAACSNWVPIRATEGPYEDPDERYTVHFPDGWVRLKGPAEIVWLTRDGIALQQIVVFRRDLAKAFPRTRKKIDPKAPPLPHELAELQLAEFKTESETLATAEVIDMTPARVGGREGFWLHLAWQNDDGLTLARLVYGVADDRYYYLIGYEAPTLHYFDKHRPAFEAMIKTFRFAAVQPPAARR